MNKQSLSALIAAHETFPAAVQELVRTFGVEFLRSQDAEGRWSPLEILVHLLDEEKEDFRPRAQAAGRGSSEVDSIDPAGWVTARDYNSREPAPVLEEFAAERSRSCEWLKSLTPEQLKISADFPHLGTMRCGDFVAAWRMHDLLHLRQLATTLARRATQELEGWEVGYAGRLPE